MIHRDINVFITLTSEYTYTHTSLDNVILINVTSQNIYWWCPLPSRSSIETTLQHPPSERHHLSITSINF